MTTERPHATVATLIERDGQFLMVKEFRDGREVYNQPAGHIEAGESIIEAAIRETLEETGWEVVPTHFGGLSVYHAPNGISYVRSTLIAKPIRPIPESQLDEGIIDAVWLTYDEVLALQHQLRSPIVRKVIEDYRQGIRYPLDIVYEQR